MDKWRLSKVQCFVWRGEIRSTKNGEIVDENYKAHCMSSMQYQKKKALHVNARDIIVVDDFNEWILIIFIHIATCIIYTRNSKI